MIEIGLPWKYNMFESPKVPPGLAEVMAGFYEQGIYPPTIGFAPDDAWSVPGMTRVIDFAVPSEPMCEYERRELLIPTADVAEVYPALLESVDSPELAAYLQPPSPVRDILVCTHGAIDACCATMGYPIYKLARHMADALQEPTRVWRCTHFGGHRFAATFLDMPTGRYWGHLEARDLAPLLRRTGDIAQMRSRYRGWAALPYGAAQVAEGELFRRAGWRWFETAVTPGETTPYVWDEPIPEQVVRFMARHDGMGVQGTVDVLVTPIEVLQTRETTKSPEWRDAQQYATRIVAIDGLERLFGEE
jgi:hypothetical protein